MKAPKFFFIFGLIMTLCTLSFAAAAADIFYVGDAGSDENAGTSASAPFATLDKAFSALGGADGQIIVCGNLTLAADAELFSAGGSVRISGESGARMICDGNLYLDADLVFENIEFYFKKSTPAIFCQGHTVAFGQGIVCTYVNTAPAVWGGSFAGKSGVTAASLTYRGYTLRIESGTWYYVRGGSLRNAEGQPVGTVGDLAIEIAGGSFLSTASDASANAVIALTGFDALDGDASLTVSGGDFACGIFGIGRPGFNSSVSNNQYTRGNVSISISGGTFAKGKIAAVQDTVASRITDNFTLGVTGGVFSGNFAGFDGSAVDGVSLADIAHEYYEAGLSATGFDDLLYVSANGSGDGLSAATPTSSVTTRGGKIVLCGKVDAAKLDLTKADKPITLTGGELALDGRLTAAAPLTLTDTVLSGTGVIDACGNDLTVDVGVTGGERIALDGGGTAQSGTHRVTLRAGCFASVTGGLCAPEKTVAVLLEGGKVLGDVIGGEGANASILITGGEVLGDVYAFAKGGKDGGIALVGGSIGGKAAAAKSPEGYSVGAFGACGVADVDTTGAVKRYADDGAVFVADGGSGDGSSPLAPLGDLAAAIQAADGGSVVLCGTLTLEGQYTLPATGKKTIITSLWQGVDFAETHGAKLVLSGGGIFCAGETLFHDLHIEAFTNSTYISAEGNRLTLGGGIECTLFPGKRVERYPTVCGGSYTRIKTLKRSTNLTIKSGTWEIVSAGSYHPSAAPGSYKITGDLALTLLGGTVKGKLYAAGYNSLVGNAVANLAGGVCDCAVFALPSGNAVVGGDITINVSGGALRGDLGYAQGDGATHNGSFTLNLAGGDLSRLGSVGTRDIGGTNTARLNLSSDIDLTAEITGTATYQNPIAGYADPSVVYADGWYYYTFAKSYGGKPGLYMAKAANLFDIGKVEPVLIWSQALTGQAADMEALWAPQLYKLNGKWYIYAACQFPSDTDDDPDLKRRYPYVWVADTDDPIGSYTFFGCMENLDTEAYSYLSPRLIEHDGNLYMFCSGFYRAEDGLGGTHIQRMRVCRLTSPTKMATAQIVISTPKYGWEKGIMEGPFPFYGKDGTLYLIFAGGHTRTDEYCTGIMRFNGSATDSLTEVSLWEKFETPLQFTDYSTGIYSPGAMVVTTSPDGKTLYGVYHAKEYHYSAYTMRRMYMQEISFDKDGFPTMTAPQPTSTVYTAALNPLPLSARISGFDARGVCSTVKRVYIESDSPFVSALVPGDTDLDGRATLRDVLRTLNFVSGNVPEAFDAVHADLDLDGKVSVADALMILRKTLG